MISTATLALFYTCSHCHTSIIIFFFSTFLLFLFNPGSFVLNSPLLFSLPLLEMLPWVCCCASRYSLNPPQQFLITEAVNSQAVDSQKRNFIRAALVAFIFWFCISRTPMYFAWKPFCRLCLITVFVLDIELSPSKKSSSKTDPITHITSPNPSLKHPKGIVRTWAQMYTYLKAKC